MRMRPFVLLLGGCLLAACGDEQSAAGNAATGEDGLPKPAAASGSVTGMPNPGVAGPRPAAPVADNGDATEVVPPDPVDEDVGQAEMPMPTEFPPPADGAPEMMPLPPPEPVPPPPPPPEQLRSGEPAAEQQ